MVPTGKGVVMYDVLDWALGCGFSVTTEAKPSGEFGVLVEDIVLGGIHEAIVADAESARQAAWLIGCLIERLGTPLVQRFDTPEGVGE